MHHDLYASLAEMLAPEALSTVGGHPVTTVRCLPFYTDFAMSGCGPHFLAVETNDGRGPRYVVKRIAQEWDCIVRATDDRYGRSVAIWQQGLLDCSPPETAHPILACAVDEAGWAILMRDVSAALLPPQNFAPLSVADNACILEALAALHATFWEHHDALDPARAFCRPWHLYTSFSPQVCRREAVEPGDLPSWIVAGWAVLERVVEPDVAAVIRGLQEDPQPLCDALARYPQTLVHGDCRAANLGLLRTGCPRVLLLDWQFAALAPPAVDLAWYLYSMRLGLPITKEAAIALYRQSLARRLGTRFSEDWWQPQLALSLLGNFLRTGWDIAYDVFHDESEAVRTGLRRELAWHSAEIRAAVQWL
jgi:hypothetical protein